jgi:hypothetical protein
MPLRRAAGTGLETYVVRVARVRQSSLGGADSSLNRISTVLTSRTRPARERAGCIDGIKTHPSRSRRGVVIARRASSSSSLTNRARVNLGLRGRRDASALSSRATRALAIQRRTLLEEIAFALNAAWRAERA